MRPGYEEFEATTLYCPRCRKAVAVRKKLLLVLPSGAKYDYLCAECGAPVGGKLDEDPSEFRRMAPGPRVLRATPAPPEPRGRPGFPGRAPGR